MRAENTSRSNPWSRLSKEREPGIIANWLGTWDNLPLRFDSTCWNSHELHFPQLGSGFCIVSWFCLIFLNCRLCQLVVLELSSLLMLRIWVSLKNLSFRRFLLYTNLFSSRFNIHDELPVIPILERKLFAKAQEYSFWETWCSLLNFRSCLTERMIFIALKKISSQIWRISKFEGRNFRTGFPIRRSARGSWDEFDFFSTKSCVDSVTHLEMNLTSNSLFQGSKLENVVHLLLSSVLFLLVVSLKLNVCEKNHNFLLAHVHTAVKPAFSVILHFQDPSLQCFQLNRNQSFSLNRSKASRHKLFQFPPCLLW